MNLTTKTYVIAKRPLRFGDHSRLPGEMCPEASSWRPRLVEAYLNQGYLEEVVLVTDADRQRATEQFEQEENARKELAEQRATEKRNIAESGQPEQPAEPVRQIVLKLVCANCHVVNDFEREPTSRELWECANCGQRQTVQQARNGTLTHADASNYRPSMWQ
jgi:ribosomal protein L44E